MSEETVAEKACFVKPAEKERRRRYYAAHRDRCIANAKKRYAKKRDEIREYKKQWAKKNKKRNYARIRKWCANNPDRNKQSKEKWLANNREKANAASKKWSLTLAGKVSVRSAGVRRRYFKDQTSNPITNAEIVLLLARSRVCFYCEKPFNEHRKATLDHILPLAKGGSHTRDNLCAACKSCNSKKNAKLPHEFAREIGRLLI